MKVPVCVGALLAVLRIAFSLKAPFYEPQTWNNRVGIVHLFEWKWLDIARECEKFLAPKGYAGIQISPPTENVIVNRAGSRPWWERYQPISYRLVTRSGNEEQFEEMTRRCNAVGIRIYVDLVINHMTADIDPAVGSGGSVANTKTKDYPAVPYNSSHFHRPCSIDNYDNKDQVRNCELVGLHDLDHSQAYVREKIIGLMNHLIDLGVAGFRVDADKHMWPGEVKMMMEGMKPLNTKYGFAPNSKPFVYQEVIDLGDSNGVSYQEYSSIGRIVDFRHSRSISRVFKGDDQLRWLRNWGPEWNLINGPISLVFVDNHDNQREENGHGPILNYKRPRQYKMAVAFMLAYPLGYPRVMSSFNFETSDQGPPTSANGDLISPEFNSKGECINGYVCEHRWRQIANMIGFRNSAGVTGVENWWDNGSNQIAFSRGNKAFIAFNNDNRILDETLPTGLPAGTYCDIISGDLDSSGRSCTGKSLVVNSNGRAHVVLRPDEEDGVVAVHVGVGSVKMKSAIAAVFQTLLPFIVARFFQKNLEGFKEEFPDFPLNSKIPSLFQDYHVFQVRYDPVYTENKIDYLGLIDEEYVGNKNKRWSEKYLTI